MDTSDQQSPNTSFYRSIANIVRKMPWIAVMAHGVMQFSRPKYSVGAVGVLFNPQGQVLLVEHVLHPKTPWGLPGGWGNRKEAPEQTVIRELHEELSITVQSTQIIAVQIQYHNHLDLAYLCHTTDPIGKLSNELLDYGWFDIDAMPRLLSFHYLAIQQASQYQNFMESQL